MMELVFGIVGVIIGVGLGLFLDVGSFANIFAKKEESMDSKAEHVDEKK